MIEVISTFILLNQFLVWVTKKILIYYDLDLVLSKYYKERLGFQLKNKEIYTNENNLTKTTELLLLTHLFIIINWISFSKPSTKRSPFLLLISSPSPLFFLSLSSQSIPSTSYHNNIIYLFLQPCLVQPTFSTSN